MSADLLLAGVAFAGGVLIECMQGSLGETALKILKRGLRKLRNPLKNTFETSMESLKNTFPEYTEALEAAKKEWDAVRVDETTYVGKKEFMILLKKHGICDKLTCEKMYLEFIEEFRKSFKKTATKGSLEEFSLFAIQEFEEAKLDRDEQLRLLQSLIQLEEAADVKLDSIIKLLNDLATDVKRTNEGLAAALQIFNQIVNAAINMSPFRYDLVTIATRLLETAPISTKVSIEDKGKIIDVARNFRNIWHYGEYLSECSSSFKEMLRSDFKRIEGALDDSNSNICLRIVINLLLLETSEIQKLCIAIDGKMDPDSKRLLMLSKELLFTKMLFDGNISATESLLDDLKKLAVETWKAEVLFMEFLSLLHHGFPRGIDEDMLRIARELEKCPKDENTAFVASLIVGPLFFIGKADQARSIMKSCKVSMYFPDLERLYEVSYLIDQREFESVRPVLLSLVVSSQLRWIREWAQVELISFEAYENPKKAIQDLTILIRDSKPIGEFLARCIFLKGTILGKIGCEQDEKELIDLALSVLNISHVNFVSATLKGEILLSKALMLLNENDLLGVSSIIREIQALPLLPRSKLQLLYLEGILALKNKDIRGAQDIFENLLESCPSTRTRIDFMQGIIQLDISIGNSSQAKERVASMLKDKEISATERALLHCLYGSICHFEKDFQNALRHYEQSYATIKNNKHNHREYVMRFGVRAINNLIRDLHNVKAQLSDKAEQDFDFEKAWLMLDTFLSFLKHSMRLPISDPNREEDIFLALNGCCKRAFLLVKKGQVGLALQEIENLLKLDLKEKERALVLLNKADIEMNYDVVKAEADVLRAAELSESWIGQPAIVLRLLKLKYIKNQLNSLDLIKEIEKMDIRSRIAVFLELGVFFGQKRINALSTLCLRKGLELTDKNHPWRKRFLFLLANVYIEYRPAKALQFISELRDIQTSDHETKMLFLLETKALIELAQYEDAERLLKTLSVEDLNQVEQQLFFNYKVNLQIAKKDWRQALFTITTALKLGLSPYKRNDFLLTKAECAHELGNTLMVMDILETINCIELTEDQRRKHCVLYQTVLVQEKQAKRAFKLFLQSLPSFTGYNKLSFVEKSMLIYPDKVHQLDVIKESFKSLEREKATIEEICLHVAMMKRILNSISIDDVRSDLDLYFLYGWSIGTENVAMSETVLNECIDQGFSPLYLVYLALSDILEATDSKKALENIEKARQLNPGNPWLIIQWSRILRRLGRYEQALELLEEVRKSTVFSLSPVFHNHIMAILIAKEDYNSALTELEKWVFAYPFDLQTKIALASAYLVNLRIDKVHLISEEILQLDEDNALAKMFKNLSDIQMLDKERDRAIYEAKEEAKKLLRGLYLKPILNPQSDSKE